MEDYTNVLPIPHYLEFMCIDGDLHLTGEEKSVIPYTHGMCEKKGAQEHSPRNSSKFGTFLDLRRAPRIGAHPRKDVNLA